MNKLYGNLRLDSETYLVYMEENKKTSILYVLNTIHSDDITNQILGQPLQHKVMTSIYDLDRNKIDKGYILAAYKRDRVTQRMSTFGRRDIIEKTLDIFGLINNYTFKKDDIQTNAVEYIEGEKAITFSAKDDTCSIMYSKNGQLFNQLRIINNARNINLSRLVIKTKIDIRAAEFIEQDRALKRRASVVNISDVSYEDLERKLDLSWAKQKDYRSIETKEDFEEYVIKDILETYKRCLENKEEFILSLDTETTGLNICYLSDTNPDKSFIVATPLSWKDNQAVVVFNDMEYFNNVPKQYMFERLRALLEKNTDIVLEFQGKKYTMDRRKINLVGHNVMYDGKVLFDNAVQPEWDNDTMQMAFNINPKAAKGKYNNKLKGLTRRIFGHETPELSDLLGKGNEDKYKYLKDKRLAILYGCADADYTRLLFKELRKLMTDHAYAAYQRQDMEMLNMLYISEYYGLKVDEDAVKELAIKAEHDLTIIHEFLMNYVGKFVEKKNKVIQLESKLRLGTISDSEFKQQVLEIKANPKARYEFKMSNNDYGKVMFEILKYPVITRTDKDKPKTDKFVQKKLMSAKLPVPSNQMEGDLMSEDGKRTLIKAKEFNKLKYPMAYVIKEYAALQKEYTAYFKPIRDTNLEGRLFKGYSLSRIETFRIMNPSQTMKGSLKALTLPFSDDHYMVDFDMAQVEYRIMVSIAGQLGMVDRLRDPEKDFHTESAAVLKGIPAHTVDKKFRKSMKAVHFGIPYGLGDHSLCETMYGSVTDTNLYETRKLKQGFCERNANVIAMLEHHRDEALKPQPFSKEFKKFCGFVDEVTQEDGTVLEIEKPVGWVRNEMGRYRLFDLSDLDKRKIGSIRRAAGNFPIQAFAAELFRVILLNFKRRCEKEGIADKVIWHMLIHDELLLSVHKSINPFYLYKLILEECMVTIEGHTEYFVGINIGNNWADAKDDLAEAPVLFVREMAKRWEDGEFKNDTWMDDAKTYTGNYMKEFITKRIYDVLLELQPDLDSRPINFDNIDKNMSNYTVRAYIGDHFIPQAYLDEEGKIKSSWKELNDTEKLLLTLCTWANRYYGDEKMIELPNGQLVNIHLFGSDETDIKEVKFDVDTLELEDDELDFFDEEGEVMDVYDFDLMFNNDSYDVASGEFTGLQLKQVKELEFIKELPKRLMIEVPRTRHIAKVKEVLKPYLSSTGNAVLFKSPTKTESWLRISKDIDLHELDVKIMEVI